MEEAKKAKKRESTKKKKKKRTNTKDKPKPEKKVRKKRARTKATGKPPSLKMEDTDESDDFEEENPRIKRMKKISTPVKKKASATKKTPKKASKKIKAKKPKATPEGSTPAWWFQPANDDEDFEDDAFSGKQQKAKGFQAKEQDPEATESEVEDNQDWRGLLKRGVLKLQTVAFLKAALREEGMRLAGRKSDLLSRLKSKAQRPRNEEA